MKLLSKKPPKWPESKIEPLASTEMPKESFASAPSPDSPSQCSLHQTCKTLSIARFKAAYCNNNLNALVISGEPTADQLQDAWNEILFEYASLFKTEESEYVFSLRKEIELLKLHITTVDYSVYTLQLHFFDNGSTDNDIINQLVELGYEVTADTSDPVAYINQLKRCVSLCKTNVFDLEQLEKEYERAQKTTGGKKITEEDFDANIVMVSKYMHYPIDEDTVTIYKFTVMFNNFLAENRVRPKTQEDGQ